MTDVGVGAIDIQLAVFETEQEMIIKMTRTQVALRHPPIPYYHLLGTNGFIETDRIGIDAEHNPNGLLYIKSEMDCAQHVNGIF